MSRVSSDYRSAVRLLDEGEARKALQLAESLIASTDEGSRIEGYMCRGMIHEEGGDGVPVDLEKSMDSYRRVSLIAPGAIPFLNLARVSLKRKSFVEAFRFLNASASFEVSPETLLGYGHYFEECDSKEPEKAKEYFFKAAMRGRFAGFFGYARVARASGQHLRALLMDCTRIASGPLIALAIGSRARFQF